MRRYLPTIILIAFMVQGCKVKKEVAKPAPIYKPVGAISFSPTFRRDSSGNVWMYNPQINKFYKLTLIPAEK